MRRKQEFVAEVSSLPIRVARNTEFHVLKGGGGPVEGVPISELNLKSSLALPWPPALPAGNHLLHGYARSPGVSIDSVHWSEDPS